MDEGTEQVVEQKPYTDPMLSKTVFRMPLDGGRQAVRFTTPRQLSQAEWERVMRWLDLMKDELIEAEG